MIISDAYNYHIPVGELSTAGWKIPNISQELSIPDGYSLAGVLPYTGTYRIAAIQPVYGGGVISFTFYLITPMSTDINIVWHVVFKKNK